VKAQSLISAEGRNVAERFWDALRSGIAAIEAVGPADLEAAWEIGVSWRDQDFSIVDRSSSAVYGIACLGLGENVDDSELTSLMGCFNWSAPIDH
jgi:hypothetical protein